MAEWWSQLQRSKCPQTFHPSVSGAKSHPTKKKTSSASLQKSKTSCYNQQITISVLSPKQHSILSYIQGHTNMEYCIMLKWVILLTVQVYQVHNTISHISILIFKLLYSYTQLQNIPFWIPSGLSKFPVIQTEYLKTDFQYRNNIMYEILNIYSNKVHCSETSLHATLLQFILNWAFTSTSNQVICRAW